MNRKGYIAFEILTLIFVPGAFTLFVVANFTKFLSKFHFKKKQVIE